jgi:hypothetical protein
MDHELSRRDFLKASTSVGLIAAINPASAVTSAKQKSRVVIATDPATANSSGTPDPAKLQDLVDHAIMTFTGKSDKAAAYEALFPAKVTSSTKIYMKRNTASGRGAVNAAVTAAFQVGLERMLGGTFPKANIDNPTGDALIKNVSNKDKADAATYIINCPLAWMNTAPGHGVTLSLKNTMNLDGPPNAHHNENPPTWLYKISLSSAIKPKLIFSLLDCVVGRYKGGPEGSPDFKAGTIIVGSDLVAVDYHGIRLLEKQGASASAIALGDKNLKEAEKAGLGTCTPENIDVITIAAPWPSVGTINGADKVMQAMNIKVLHQGNKIDFIIPGKWVKNIAIFDMMGNVQWQSQNNWEEIVTWNIKNIHGVSVPAGMYVYRIASKNSIMRGTVMVTH